MNATNHQNTDNPTQKVILYLDGELPSHEQQALLTEIERNPNLLEKYNMERSFRDFLKNKVSKKSISPTLVESIKTKLRTVKIDQSIHS